jgi:hypothetical protein
MPTYVAFSKRLYSGKAKYDLIPQVKLGTDECNFDLPTLYSRIKYIIGSLLDVTRGPE